jgi:maleylacetate reductase
MRFVHELVTPRVVFGAGSLASVREEVQRLAGTRVLLVAGPHSVDARLRIERDLGAAVAGIVSEVVEHVPVDCARAAVEHADRAGADLLLTLGGGSATGLAKAVALERGLPILAVPTTYAGSEMTSIWGLTEDGRKTTGRDQRVRPRTVLYDPELTLSMPAALTAASGMNALAHCVEAAYAADASPVVRIAAIEAVRALAQGLPGAIDDPSDVGARSVAFYGAWLAGMTLGNASMGIHHKLCHVLGGAYRLPHGALHAAVIPYVTAYNRDAVPDVMAQLAAALGSRDAAGGLWDLAERIGAPRSLAEVGFPADGVEQVVERVLSAPPANPCAVDREGVRRLLEAALAGRRPPARDLRHTTMGDAR